MASRVDLHNLLKQLLGIDNVYYQAPARMDYPAIKYTKLRPDVKYANDKKYLNKKAYQIIVISRRPDDPVIDKILALPLSSYDRWYAADGLNHDVITLYF